MNYRYDRSPSMWKNKPLAFVFCSLLCLFLIGIPILIVWRLVNGSTRLMIDDSAVTLKTGFFSKQVNQVLIRDVKNIRVDQSLWQRLVGIGTVDISSSGQSGVEIHAVGFPLPYEIKRLIDAQR